MVKKRQQTILLAGIGAILALVLYFWLRPAPAVPSAAAAARPGPRGAAAAPEGSVARIGLDRIGTAPGGSGAGQRDLFAFGQPPTPPPTPEPPPTLPPVNDPATTIAEMPPTPPPLPPLNVKYMGSLEAKPGLRVAFFLTEKKDIVTGQVGEVVMNRFKIMKIGFESADIQEVGADQVRRLPLRGGS
jgi:hypothetical protein